MKTEDRTVAVGTWAAKLLVTDVINDVLPPISYELTDEGTLLAEPNPDPGRGDGLLTSRVASTTRPKSASLW